MPYVMYMSNLTAPRLSNRGGIIMEDHLCEGNTQVSSASSLSLLLHEHVHLLPYRQS